MKVTQQLSEVRNIRWRDPNSTWGLVPTMGALHQGHISLIRRARTENDNVAVSIFINPIQFNDPDDFEAYPVVLEEDLEILKNEKVDLVWTPLTTDIYPPDFQTYVQVEHISKPLEGKKRPGHFRGVTTIVSILFNTFQPHRAYFGQKDAQQLLVIKQMTSDLKLNLEIVSCPTVREEDGLAISSRNRNLSEAARKQAVCLFESLSKAKNIIIEGEQKADNVKAVLTAFINTFPLAKIDYISIADPSNLVEVELITGRILISLAVFIEDIRLIDNMIIEV